MHNNFNRMMAYLIDMFIVIFIIDLFQQVNFLNPYKDKYNAEYEKFYDKYSEVLEDPMSVKAEDLYNSETYTSFKKIAKYGASYRIIEGVIIILYFSLFPYFNKGRTIGKQFMRLKLVDKNENDLPFYKHFLRSLILPILDGITFTSAIWTLLLTCFTFTLGAGNYFLVSLNGSMFVTFFCIADILAGFIRKDKRFLHDVILGTKVI